MTVAFLRNCLYIVHDYIDLYELFNRLISSAFFLNAMRKKILIGSALFLIALLLRLSGISFHSLWFDETSTALCVTQHSYSDMLKTVHTIEATPPLFFILEKAFIDGLHLKLNEFSLRFPPVVCGALMCLLFFLIFQEFSSKKTSIFAFLLIAFSNFHIFTSQDARSYSLFCLLAMATLYGTLLWWKKPDRLRSIGFFIVVVLTIQVHYYAVLWIAALFASVLVVKFKQRRLKKYLCILAGAGVFSFAVLVPLFLTQVTYEINPIRHYLLAKWMPGIVYSPVKVLIGAYLFKIHSIGQITPVDWLGIVPTILLIAIAAFFFLQRLRQGKAPDSEKIVTFGVIVAFFLHSIMGWKIPTIHPQYMQHFFLLLFGCIMVNTASRKYIQIGAFCVLMVLNAIADFNFYNPSKMYIEPWKNIAAAVDSAIVAGGANSESILGEYVSCLPIAFYLQNKSTPIFQIASPFNPTEQFTITHLNVFGSDFYTNLFHFKYFPSNNQTSFMDIIKKNKHGILITSKDGPISALNVRLNQMYRGTIDFSILKIFDTNQGSVALFHWNYLSN